MYIYLYVCIYAYIYIYMYGYVAAPLLACVAKNKKNYVFLTCGLVPPKKLGGAGAVEHLYKIIF